VALPCVPHNNNLDEVLGDDAGVTGLRLKNNDGSTKDIDVHGVFIAIGHTPNTGIYLYGEQ
jgi:thioredoxin reductase (NADPH)